MTASSSSDQKPVKVKKDKKDMTFKEKVVENVKLFFSAYLIAFVIRLFFIEAYQIPSQSMVPNLKVKDTLMVQKLSFGPIIPVVKWKLPGFGRPHRNDIIVFVTPEWKSPGIGKELVSLLTLSIWNLDNTFDSPKNLVKRLVALPGDTLSMSNQRLILNGEVLDTEYVATVEQKVYNQLYTMGYDYFNLYAETYSNQTRVVQHQKQIDGAYFYYPENFTNMDIFDLFDTKYRHFLVTGFPAIYVPRKGDVIQLADTNPYYRYLLVKLIERESGKNAAVINGKVFLDGQEITEWKVKDNYYFGMGDNRDSSEDCRYFGFIPERNIFGKILFRYFPFGRFAFKVNETAKSVIKEKFM